MKIGLNEAKDRNHSVLLTLTKKTLELHQNKSCAIKEVLKLTKKINQYLYENTETPKQYRNALEKQSKILSDIIRLRESENLDSEIFISSLLNVKNELYLMAAEEEEDLLYLPNGKVVKTTTIKDIIYYEGLYGKVIYQKAESLGEKVKEW
tara:strand:+ start:1636 stop:2088 length:453 start_codon:yes stop_codon:yes gene_type:complete